MLARGKMIFFEFVETFFSDLVSCSGVSVVEDEDFDIMVAGQRICTALRSLVIDLVYEHAVQKGFIGFRVSNPRAAFFPREKYRRLTPT